jgi:hypothetical protein
MSIYETPIIEIELISIDHSNQLIRGNLFMILGREIRSLSLFDYNFNCLSPDKFRIYSSEILLT